MNKTLKITLSLLLVFIFALCSFSCSQDSKPTLWENATYTEDTTLGNGANTVSVLLTAGEKTITFTIKTDKATLGEALFENNLINDPTFFDVCNGITASWEKDNAYWGFFVGDSTAPASYGVGDEKSVTAGNPTYRIVYTK